MKYESQLEQYLNFLHEKFPVLSIEQCNMLFRYFKIVVIISDLKDLAISKFIVEKLPNINTHIYRQLRRLVKHKIIKKIGKLGNFDIYSLDVVDDKLLSKFLKYVYCCKCGKKVGQHGGIIRTNLQREKKKLIYCTKECACDHDFVKKWFGII